MIKFLIQFSTRFIPRHRLQIVAHQFLKMLALFYKGNRFEDPIDGKTYRKLLPYGRVQSRKNALAPHSMSLERHRLIWLYIEKKTNFFTHKHKFLHVAPEFCFLQKFKNMPNLDYITGDLNSPWAKVKMDVHQIPFAENTFDAAMCNHVFEHVENDIKAMKEFYRVLKPGGWAIFQVPLEREREITYEDKNITSDREREKHFGQRDHVRAYGRDYGKRLQMAGFKVTEDDFVNQIGDALVERNALPAGEIVYFCQKI